MYATNRMICSAGGMSPWELEMVCSCRSHHPSQAVDVTCMKQVSNSIKGVAEKDLLLLVSQNLGSRANSQREFEGVTKDAYKIQYMLMI